MGKRLIKNIILAIVLFFSTIAWAENYNVQLAVVDRSAKVRAEVLPLGLAQVVVRASGSDEILTAELFQQAKLKVDDYIASFAYLADNEGILQLKIKFSKPMIVQLLSAAGKRVWDQTTPIVVLWINSQENQEVSSKIIQLAEKKGITIITPLGDLRDLAAVDADDITLLNVGKIIAGTKRYNTATSIAGTVTKVEDNWQGKWLFTINEQAMSWENITSSIDEMALDVTEKLIRQLTEDYASAKYLGNANSAKVQLAVTGIENLEKYASVFKYLKELSSVETIGVASVSPVKTVFNLQVIGGKLAVAKDIANGDCLENQGSEYRVK